MVGIHRNLEFHAPSNGGIRRGISLRLVDYSEKEQREMEEERGGYL
jgi:hypothetical protein